MHIPTEQTNFLPKFLNWKKSPVGDCYFLFIFLLVNENILEFKIVLISVMDKDTRTVFCGNLNSNVTEGILYELFLQV